MSAGSSFQAEGPATENPRSRRSPISLLDLGLTKDSVSAARNRRDAGLRDTGMTRSLMYAGEQWLRALCIRRHNLFYTLLDTQTVQSISQYWCDVEIGRAHV